MNGDFKTIYKTRIFNKKIITSYIKWSNRISCSLMQHETPFLTVIYSALFSRPYMECPGFFLSWFHVYRMKHHGAKALGNMDASGGGLYSDQLIIVNYRVVSSDSYDLSDNVFEQKKKLSEKLPTQRKKNFQTDIFLFSHRMKLWIFPFSNIGGTYSAC